MDSGIMVEKALVAVLDEPSHLVGVILNYSNRCCLFAFRYTRFFKKLEIVFSACPFGSCFDF